MAAWTRITITLEGHTGAIELMLTIELLLINHHFATSREIAKTLIRLVSKNLLERFIGHLNHSPS